MKPPSLTTISPRMKPQNPAFILLLTIISCTSPLLKIPIASATTHPQLHSKILVQDLRKLAVKRPSVGAHRYPPSGYPPSGYVEFLPKSTVETDADTQRNADANKIKLLNINPPEYNPIANGQIISILGNVQLQRNHGTPIQPTTGTPLYPGDQLQTADGGEIIIQCANLTLWTIKTGQNQINRCPTETAETTDAKCTRDIAQCPDRGDQIARNDPTIPYIISPRRTLILTHQPTIRWNPVAGTTQYTLRLSGGGKEWQTQLTQPFLTYSGEIPIQPGIYYSLKIETDTGAFSFAENIPGLGFKLIDNNQQQQIQTAINQLNTWQLNSTAKALSLAYLYNKYELKAEAINTLETIIAQGDQTPALFRNLGNLYWQIGLADLAESHYQKAIQLTPPNDIEGQALATAEIATLYQALGETETAIQYLNQAISQYQTLQNSQQVNQLNQQLKVLINH